MSIATNKVDFIAVLHYRTAEQGGRSTPAFNSYRPQVKFAFTEMQTSGQQKFITKEIVYPGDVVEAEIKLASPHLFENKLSVGMAFELREGARIVATGEVKEILNLNLSNS